jgi:DNA-binding IclR family transcriptional regulator
MPSSKVQYVKALDQMTSSLSKMLGILDLFEESTPAWTADDICERLGFSTSTGYRYIRELCDAGLLNRLTGGFYVLGTRIVELEYVMRTSDPIAKVGRPILEALSAATGCDVLLSSIQGFHVVNVLHERGVEHLNVSYIRGRQHPLFRGAVAKAILPFLPRSQLVKLYEGNQEAIARSGMGGTWLEFWRALQLIKRAGYSESHGELDPNLSGLGVPVLTNEGVVGSITVVYSSARGRLLNVNGLVEELKATAQKMNAAIQGLSAPGANPVTHGVPVETV